jgi:hypothetical protein
MAVWRWTRGYVENIAVGIALSVVDDRAAGRVYNLGPSTTLSEAEWVRAIGTAADWHGRIQLVPKKRLPAHLSSDMDVKHHLTADTTRIRQELGYREPIPFDEALRRTVAWQRANPPGEIDPEIFDYVVEDAILNLTSKKVFRGIVESCGEYSWVDSSVGYPRCSTWAGFEQR